MNTTDIDGSSTEELNQVNYIFSRLLSADCYAIPVSSDQDGGASESSSDTITKTGKHETSNSSSFNTNYIDYELFEESSSDLTSSKETFSDIEFDGDKAVHISDTNNAEESFTEDLIPY